MTSIAIQKQSLSDACLDGWLQVYQYRSPEDQTIILRQALGKIVKTLSLKEMIGWMQMIQDAQKCEQIPISVWSDCIPTEARP